MLNAMSEIRHIVVVVLENRSFDNMLGWLYADRENSPPRNCPPATVPTFDGLAAGEQWNPANRRYFSGAAPKKVFARRGTAGRCFVTGSGAWVM